jgi:8-amino-7-oxononanoate synthase
LFHVEQDTPPALAFLDDAIDEARSLALLRSRRPPPLSTAVSFCSNDYLGLARRPAPTEESGAGASRLVTGERAIHRELEGVAADLVQQPSALVFTSGYAANVGMVAALAGPGDLLISDSLNHASLIDGARLSRARVCVVPHLDASAVGEALRAPRSGRAFVLTESYFSMDADSPDLPALRRLCDEHTAVLCVDEAHALGVLGPGGRGLCAEAGIRPDVVVGTFGKAFGAGGAFVAGCTALITWLWNRARSFVFSTGLSPVVAAAALEGLRSAEREPHLRAAVRARARQLRACLSELGVLVPGHGHIVPWILGGAREALAAADVLGAHGFDVRPIRPPSVPPGTSRLRLTVTAAHGEADVARLAAAIAAALRRGSACPGA